MKKSITDRHHYHTSLFLIFTAVLSIAAATAVVLILFKSQLHDLSAVQSKELSYQHHYVYIASDFSSPYSQSIYEMAQQEGTENGDYIEFMGQNLDVSYTKCQLMEIAIAAKVDGIIVEGDESEALTELIYKADQQKIPVVTVNADCTGSARKSYIGLPYYSLGQEYGKQLIKLAKDKVQNVLILMSPNTIGTGQNLIFSGIRDYITKSENSKYFNLSSMATGDGTLFSAEESVSDIFAQKNDSALPDIIVCLDENNTTCACQAVVDYNQVGNVSILGYYSNQTILDAISKNILTCTITVDTQKMGQSCVDLLDEYLKTGYVSQFSPIDPQIIDVNNIRSYISSSNEATDENSY